jgi:hypothetical protein
MDLHPGCTLDRRFWSHLLGDHHCLGRNRARYSQVSDPKGDRIFKNQQDNGDRAIFLDILRRGRSLCKTNRLK